jgi:UPF0716 protein FxsA
MWLIVAILALPLIEIGLFVTLGSAIGLWPTLLWVVLSAALGIIVLKGVGMMGPVSLSRNMQEFGDPLSPLAHRLLVVLAGGFLLIPGFFTDAVGLLLLIPPVRKLAIALIGRRFRVVQSSAQGQADIVDGEWREVDPAEGQKSGKPGSEWTRH